MNAYNKNYTCESSCDSAVVSILYARFYDVNVLTAYCGTTFFLYFLYRISHTEVIQYYRIGVRVSNI